MPRPAKLMAAIAAVATLPLATAPLAAAETDSSTTLDMASWRDMQCLSMLYMSLTDPKNAQNEKLKASLQLNIGYHLGQLNARSSEVAPSDLILSAINKTFKPDGIPADVKSYCQNAAQTVTKEGVAVEMRINSAIKAAEQKAADQQAAPDSGGR